MPTSIHTTEDFYKTLVENCRELICRHEPDGKYIYVSPSIFAIAGYLPEELVGLNPYDLFHPDDREHVRTISHIPTLQGEKSNYTEYRFRNKQGGYVWLQSLTQSIKDEEGTILELVTSSREISAIVELQSKLKESELLLEEAGKIAGIGAWEYVLSSKKLTLSAHAYEIHGIERNVTSDLFNQINKCYSKKDVARLSSSAMEAIKDGNARENVLSIKTYNGKNIWVKSIIKAKSEEGEVTKLYGTIQDITVEVEDQNRLTLMIENLAQQKKQLLTFNQIVSHNLRSPISNLNTLVSFVEKSKTEEEKVQYFYHIKRVSESLQRMLNDLVDAVKSIHHEKNEVEELDVQEVVKKQLALLQGDIVRTEANIVCDLGAWSTICYSRMYLESIVLNLVSNALKYYSEKRTPEIYIETFFEQGRKALMVKDNGLGINLEKHGDKIFELHHTFHAERPGKGLGLFMTKNQVEAMGGSLHVLSKEDVGSEFIVFFVKK